MDDFTDAELALLTEALDSHMYWQLAPPERRDSGYVMEPLTDEERECETLADKINTILRSRREETNA